MISIIIPFYNEADSLPTLIKNLIKVVGKTNEPYEIVAVDDGSTDNPPIYKWKVPCLKIIKHRKKFGKGRALQSGIEHATGNIIVFMDGDLQDDPQNLPEFYEKIKKGCDFVNGARVNRQDNFLVKTYSGLAKKFLKIFLNSPFTDVNCGYKMFRKEILEEISLYGNNFRFLPLAAYYCGFTVTEIPVINHQRLYGRSKFGSGKLVGGIFDTFTAYFIYRFSERPLHFFGTIGGILFLTGFLLTLYLAIERIFFNMLLYRRPALLLGVLLIIVGLQIVMTGVIGELVVYLNKKKI